MNRLGADRDVGRRRSLRLRSRVIVRNVSVPLLHAAFILGCVSASFAAPPIREDFEGPKKLWQHSAGGPSIQILRHERRGDDLRKSTTEGWQFRVATSDNAVRWELPIAPVRVLDELQASLWIRADRPGWSLAFRVVAPHASGTQNSDSPTFLLPGRPSEQTGRWEQITCASTDREVAQKLVWLRAKLDRPIDGSGLYVDRVILQAPTTAGTFAVATDDLEVAPVVLVDARTGVETAPAVAVPPLELQLNRLILSGRPFLPRVVPFHGEDPEQLRRLGVNTVWVPDFKDQALLEQLAEKGLWATAAPPQVLGADGAPLDAQAAGLPPLPESCDRVLFWMMGTRLGRQERASIGNWAEQVQSADRRRGRPLAADVQEDERRYSRHVPLLGLSRHPIHTTCSFGDYRDWMIERRSMARPGTFLWTWIQTESPLVNRSPSAAAGLIEPEQLRLQVYSALAAGCKGFGFWTTQPLQATDAVSRERFLAIAQLNDELTLLEPWLGTAGSTTLTPVTLTTAPATPSARNLGFGQSPTVAMEREGQLQARESQLRQQQRVRHELTAAAMRTDIGTLLLPMWLDQQAQFVVPQSAASNVELVIPGAEESASVWELSTTEVRSLHRERVTGGMRITLPRFDVTTMLWITTKPEHVDRVRERIAQTRNNSAQIAIELAKLKLDRVGLIDQQLQAAGSVVVDGPQLLGLAKIKLDRAEAELRAGNAHKARLDSAEALQSLRILQRDHWDRAVKRSTSPVSSPFLASYQTLPEHWRLLAQLERSPASQAANLLPSGGFEDFDTHVAEGWQHQQSGDEGLRASAKLHPGGRQGGYALQLVCEPAAGAASPQIVADPPVTVVSPTITVHAGTILHISGWVKLSGPITASRDGVMISESLLGRTAALRMRESGDWQRFELIRPVTTSTQWQLTICLTGLGDALIDDLRVVPHEPAAETATIIQAAGSEPAPAPKKFWDRLPRLRGKNQNE